ncbi:HNH endonuclease [Arthrobacter pityocampae]|uniref:HNH endonuclease n=1 Tax=Arthrobacter pityocampae TaxID=547334 RepID=UPI00373607FF
MLRRADNVKFTHRPGFWTGRGPAALSVGKKVYLLGKITKAEWRGRQEHQREHPMPLTTIAGRRYWKFQDKYYWENDGLSSEQIYALLYSREQHNRQRIERAQANVVMGSAPRTASVRRAIPDDVKQYVMNRDGGRCQSCGSTSEIQYDHVIPLAMGGSSNEANLQILCGPCNRSKGAGLTTRRR